MDALGRTLLPTTEASEIVVLHHSFPTLSHHLPSIIRTCSLYKSPDLRKGSPVSVHISSKLLPVSFKPLKFCHPCRHSRYPSTQASRCSSHKVLNMIIVSPTVLSVPQRVVEHAQKVQFLNYSCSDQWLSLKSVQYWTGLNHESIVYLFVSKLSHECHHI